MQEEDKQCLIGRSLLGEVNKKCLIGRPWLGEDDKQHLIGALLFKTKCQQ
jgi:hypothetical protein